MDGLRITDPISSTRTESKTALTETVKDGLFLLIIRLLRCLGSGNRREDCDEGHGAGLEARCELGHGLEPTVATRPGSRIALMGIATVEWFPRRGLFGGKDT